jgi:hypothetical protein
MIPYKKNVFILKLPNMTNNTFVFEPFYTDEQKFFGYNDKIINKITNSTFLAEHIDYNFNNEQDDPHFKITKEDIKKYLTEEDIIQIENNNKKKESIFIDKFDEHEESDDEMIENLGITERGKHDELDIDIDDSSFDLNTNDIDTKYIITDSKNNVKLSKSNNSSDNSSDDSDDSDDSDYSEDSDEEESDEEEVKIEKVDSSYKVKELRVIAKENNIILSYTVNNKKRQKTKQMLIDEINKLSD